MRLVLASANPDKSKEIAAILTAAVPKLDLVPRPADVADVDETGITLLENARLKAAAIAAATGEPAVADDTGLLVDALDGAPGVHSARFAGEGATYADNVAKLLVEMAGVPPERRTARFETVALVRWPDGREVAATGSVDGVIITDARGTYGFGYDPVFEPTEGEGRTFGELLPVEKHALSHRGRAFRALAAELAKLP
jgi:XTP/dITP diphosphohydrolase